jgi:predicted amidophosphoribosyltransferase
MGYLDPDGRIGKRKSYIMSRTISSPTEIALCSFCTKANTEVETLIAGLDVFICDQCVSECVTVIANRSGLTREPSPWEADVDLYVVLGRLSNVIEAYRQADRDLAGCLRKARFLGASWSQLRDALDCYRQTASERFSAEV